MSKDTIQTGPSPNLSWRELACRDDSPYPAEWRLTRAVELAKAFERIRELCGFPLIVNSAYRSAVYNDSIGGATHSQHVQGRALDLCPPTGIRNAMMTLRGACDRARSEGLIRGIGIYRGFVHVDTRPGKAATWRGSRGPE